jgi:hypothetical protein
MSDKYPECPLYNPLNCKEYHNPKLCALARPDQHCLKKQKPRQSNKTGEAFSVPPPCAKAPDAS